MQIQASKQKLAELYRKHSGKLEIGFFLLGFLFDAWVTVDLDLLSILQQAIYLLLIGGIFRIQLSNRPAPSWLSKVWKYHALILHFLLGSLLSVYSVFYIKSASLASSALFLLVVLALMVANELETFRRGKFDLRIPLYALSLFSFFSVLLPSLLGFVGATTFILSLLLSVLALFATVWRLHLAELRRAYFAPAIVSFILLLICYLAGIIPPVPISLKKIGVYHSVNKEDGVYILSYQRAWWKFWQSDSRDFYARPGDKLHLFVAIYSPAKFEDSVLVRWSYFDQRLGWQATDAIAMKILGGRQEGFRGFITKSNYTAGPWRVTVETTDGREIGRLNFSLSLSQDIEERNFHTEEYY